MHDLGNGLRRAAMAAVFAVSVAGAEIIKEIVGFSERPGPLQATLAVCVGAVSGALGWFTAPQLQGKLSCNSYTSNCHMADQHYPR
ncbi:hypothetical protein [Mangrovihabitans endophyticus]|uniref:hypothetical protein n=1 Tax=Mangrovihabitans endophyticus TaxID=1751298 RepID=UPI00166DB583|nr:hypothetical protein [Mangrovihabitans endophyticus]